MQDDKAAEGKSLPPYVPYKTFRNFLEGLRVAMPSRIDRSIMGSLSGAIQSQLISALKYLKLIGPTDTPTDKLTRLVNSEGVEQQKVLRDILHAGYPFIFHEGFELARATPRQIDEQFGNVGATGDTVRKCIAFFISISKDAGISMSPHIKSKQRAPRQSSQRNRKSNGEPASPQTRENDDSSARPESLGWAQLLLAKFPSFDPAWSPDVQSKWFDSFGKLMKSVPREDDGSDLI
ncbi:MAG: DUF5343 domain-containing protein [Nitrospira sp.]|nr:DUF5343 domain-containing protein [Nitrospira sp.]